MILVGSRAMNFYTTVRPPKDWDFILPLAYIHNLAVMYRDRIDFLHAKNEWKFMGRLNTGERFEIEVADYNPSAMYLWERRHHFGEAHFNKTGGFLGIKLQVPGLSWLREMKRSHLYWNVHWEKSIADYHTLKKFTSKYDVDEEHEIFYQMRLKENEAKWGKSEAKLDMSNDDFFKKSSKIGRTYEHDEIHEAVKYYDVPLFQMAKTDQSKANLNQTMFTLWSEEQKLRLVREEAMVIALERKLIPAQLVGDPSDAYSYALRRICTNLTSGWFRDFAIENWPKVNKPDVDFVRLFNAHFRQ